MGMGRGRNGMNDPENVRTNCGTEGLDKSGIVKIGIV